MQEKLQREEEELKREKERFIEEREAQRLQRYISPSTNSGSRETLTVENKYSRSPAATVSGDRATERVMENDRIVTRQQSYGPSTAVVESSVPGRVLPEKQRMIVDDGRSNLALSSDAAIPRQVGPYQQEQLHQARRDPGAATSYRHPVPSQHLPASSVPASNLPSSRNSGQLQHTTTPRDDAAGRNRHQLSTSLDGSAHFGPRRISDDIRFAAQPAGHQRELQSEMTRPAVYVEQQRPEGQWRMASYEYGDDANGVRQHNRPQLAPGRQTFTLPSNADPYRNVGPYRPSTSTSQPDLLQYLDPVPDRYPAPRPSGEPLRRSDESYRLPAYDAYRVSVSHSRSASNPVILRAHGGNASSGAVDSLFSYHQKAEPTADSRTHRPSSQSSQYVPPPAAVQQISLQAQSMMGAAPAKPPRLAPSAAHPYEFRGRRDSDPEGHAEYTQQVSTVTPVF